MARSFMYVYERVLKEQNAMDRVLGKISVNGRKTSQADQKRIRKIISDSSYQVAQECQILVSYPRMRIEGRRVVLGEPTIMLPNCRIITMEELKKIELGGVKTKGVRIFVEGEEIGEARINFCYKYKEKGVIRTNEVRKSIRSV